MADTTFSKVDPLKDIQSFISKNSNFAENDEQLISLYKEVGMYNLVVENNA